MFACLLLMCSLLWASHAQAAIVAQVPAEKLPELPMGLTLTSPYSSGPSPVLDMQGTVRQVLERLIPDGWTVQCEKSVVNTRTSIVAKPTASWMAELEKWMMAPGLRALVRPETREVFVRKSVGGYKYEAVQPWQEAMGGAMHWTIQGGRPLREQLDNWARMGGYTLFWEAPLDFKMKGTAAFSGSFEAAIQQLFDVMYHNGEMSLKATIYRGNRVIRVRQD